MRGCFAPGPSGFLLLIIAGAKRYFALRRRVGNISPFGATYFAPGGKVGKTPLEPLWFKAPAAVVLLCAFAWRFGFDN